MRWVELQLCLVSASLSYYSVFVLHLVRLLLKMRRVELQLCLVSASLSYYFVLCYIWLDLCTNFHLGLLYFAHQTDGDQ